MKFPLFVCAALALAACAKSPDKIAAVEVDRNSFAAYNCNQLRQSYVENVQNLQVLSAAQKSAQDADALGVFLIGLPVSSMGGGDKETDIAVTKGRLQGIQRTAVAKNCTLPEVQVVTPAKK